MTSLRRKAVDNALKVIDITIMSVTFLFSLYCFSPSDIPSRFLDFLSYKLSLINLIALVALVYGWISLFSQFGLYESRRFANLSKEMFDVFRAVSLGVLMVGAVSLLLGRGNVNRQVLLLFWVSCTLLTILARALFRRLIITLRNNGRNLRHVLFIGSNRQAIELAQKILSRRELGYKLVGFADDQQPAETIKEPHAKVVCSLDDLPEFLENHIVDEVYLMLPVGSYYERIRQVIRLCQELGIVCRVPSNWFEIHTLKTAAFELDDEPILTVYTGSRHQLSQLWLKRVIDFCMSAAALILLSPVFLLIAVLIKIDSPGPVFFVQDRIGYNRRRFKMIKFRTMIQGAEALQDELQDLNEADGPAFKIHDDPRVTRVGRFLRKTSLDELPQLINVLKGDMSLVGPRPLPVRDVNGIEKRWQKRRFSMRPGMTCLWQVGGRNQLSFEEWMKLDLEYIDRWSIQLDLKILAKTLPAIFKGTGV
ncbi:MAG: sugar transferase [candidate division KSB1 bacterium]|nr:sugar transferase [candidate division KSB1 bacterium]